MEKIELEKFGHNFLRWPNCDKRSFHTQVLKGGDSDFKRLEGMTVLKVEKKIVAAMV